MDLREYYEKEGELLPGKKGIALDLAQWEKLVEAVPDINAAVQQQEGPQKSHSKVAPGDQHRLLPTWRCDLFACATETLLALHACPLVNIQCMVVKQYDMVALNMQLC